MTSQDKIILDRGCQLDMEKLDIMCFSCNWSGTFKHYEEHLNNVHLNPFCEYCGKECKTVDFLTEHTSMCKNAIVDCVLKLYGCNEQFCHMNAKDHFLSEQHQSALLKYLSLKNQHSINDQLEISSQKKPTINEVYDKNFQELYKTMDTILGSIQVLNDDSQCLWSKSLHYQTTLENMSEELLKLKISIEETRSIIDAHPVNQRILEESLISLQQEINDQKNISMDGTFIWKITNLQQKIADAQSERQISIYSPAFYSSPTGYKIRVRLYLNGDGNARRTHMSIFFVLMRGEYDAILRFPFCYKVTFCLFDQISQQQHIIDSFRPDTKSNSFQKPCSDMNIASGIPKFIPLTIIQQDNNPYVRDDTIFIKTLVDFDEIQKSFLPYKLSLNPGLPLLIQQEFLKRELKRREQEKLLNTTQTSTSVKNDMRTNINENNDEPTRKELPNLKCFSLSSDCETDDYDGMILPLLHQSGNS
ncbi:unnamed protein product [Rotaria sp. Silwood1]|nr:unnamed protein product [Rotaria sp. Silwood1]CAF4871523.1 unnamed protein product [Rotaria sp. Silwood1]